jgi:chromosome segregation ATPase
MTIGSHEMNEEENADFFQALERVNRAGNAVRVIVWALGSMIVAGMTVTVWVWTVNRNQVAHEEELRDIKPRVSALETRAVKYDASPPPSISQFHEIDKRLDRTETQLADIRELNSLILESVKKLESKP